VAQIVFLTGVQDRIALAQRLVRKKVREGGRVCVLGVTPDLRRLSHALWSEPQLEFLPHVHTRVSPEPVVRELTPVWLVEQAVEGLDCDSVINLGVELPDWIARFERVAEIVGVDDEARASGRQRWKAYERAGHELLHHAGG